LRVVKPPAPRDSQPHLSLTTFAALSRGPSALAARAKGGTIVTYTDSQPATTTFVVRQAVGRGELSHGKCVKPGKSQAKHRRSCTIYRILGQFRHSDTAGANRFRFTGRVSGHALRPASYQLLSTPKNTLGEIGVTHENRFTIT
jgi:hypothetical protein